MKTLFAVPWIEVEYGWEIDQNDIKFLNRKKNVFQKRKLIQIMEITMVDILVRFDHFAIIKFQ